MANMRRHTTLHCKMRNIVYPCKHCDARFNNYSAVFDHNQLEHSSNQTGSGKTRKTRSESALKGKARKYYVFPKKEEKYDIITFFANVKDEASNFIIKKCEKSGQLKWYIIIHVTMIRQRVNKENEITHPYFRSETTHILTVHDKDFEHNINSSFQKMFKSLDEFIRKDSSWSLKKIEKLEIHTASYHAIGW